MAQRDQFISWGGEDRTFSPSFRFLRTLDARLEADEARPSGLVRVADTAINGGREYMDLPVVWAEFLREAKFEATEDECWACLSAVTSGDGTHEQQRAYQSFVVSLCGAVIPHVDMGKLPALDDPPTPSQSATATGG